MNTVTRIPNTFTDDMVVDAARLSFNARGENYTPERNAKLIEYLVKHRHVNPFFHGMRSLLIPKALFNSNAMLENKELCAGLNFCEHDDEHWIITSNAWGFLSLAKETNCREVLSYIRKLMPETATSFDEHIIGEATLDWYSDGFFVMSLNPPYFHQWFSFFFETDMCTKAQFYTHTVGLAKSSQSYRYIEANKFYVPEEWRVRADNVKQGSSDETVEECSEYGDFCDQIAACLNWYDANSHICNEQRRLILPQAQMSKYVITGTREAWERVCRLRCAPDAQNEIRVLAETIQEELKKPWRN